MQQFFELNTLLTLDEVCAWLRISSPVVKRLCRERKIPGALKGGKNWRFNSEALATWIESQKEARN
jgi:excisionase family DNA binding protein